MVIYSFDCHLMIEKKSRWCTRCRQSKPEDEFLLYGVKYKKGIRGKSALECYDCRERRNERRRVQAVKFDGPKQCIKITVAELLEGFEKDVAQQLYQPKPQTGFTSHRSLIHRTGDPRHKDIYYHITDISQYTISDIHRSPKERAEDICERLITQIEEILGYIFHPKPLIEVNDRGNKTAESREDDMADTEVQGYFTKLYRCSQDKTSANYSNYISTVSRRKQRRRTVEQRYGCCGRIHIFIPQDGNGRKIAIPTLGAIEFQRDEILLRFSHNCTHGPRKRKPVPISIRNFIKDPVNACRTASEMYAKVFHAASIGVLNVDMTEITDNNVRYWWSQVRKQVYQRDKDPWASAVALLQETSDVVVHSYIHERRRFFCWYVAKLFDLDPAQTTEVYIDSTHGTNGQNAELFGIIGCEDGYGVPIGYMLMEKKPKEDSYLYPGEVTAACTRFFYHANELGLKPKIAHTDKCAAEIAAIKVCILSH